MPIGMVASSASTNSHGTVSHPTHRGASRLWTNSVQPRPTALLDLRKLAVSLGFDISEDGMDQPVTARGYRVPSRIPS